MNPHLPGRDGLLVEARTPRYVLAVPSVQLSQGIKLALGLYWSIRSVMQVARAVVGWSSEAQHCRLHKMPCAVCVTAKV